MKHFILVLALGGLMIASPLFASGAAEESDAPSIEEQWETLTITGEVSFADWPTPEITSRGTTYELAVPRFGVEELGVEAGDSVTVTGILVDRRADGDEPVLMVVSAIIDGEEYTAPHRSDSGQGDPRRDGPAGRDQGAGRGPNTGPGPDRGPGHARGRGPGRG